MGRSALKEMHLRADYFFRTNSLFLKIIFDGEQLYSSLELTLSFVGRTEEEYSCKSKRGGSSALQFTIQKFNMVSTLA